MTLEERERLTQTLATTTAPHLVFAVWRRDKQLVNDLIGHLDRQHLMALAVVLADQIPPPHTRPEDGLVDEVAVARAAAGETIPLTRTERDMAARLMARRGASLRRIAEHLHMSSSTVKQLLEAPAPEQTDLLQEHGESA